MLCCSFRYNPITNGSTPHNKYFESASEWDSRRQMMALGCKQLWHTRAAVKGVAIDGGANLANTLEYARGWMENLMDEGERRAYRTRARGAALVLRRARADGASMARAIQH